MSSKYTVPPLIGLTGQKRVGKDSVAAVLVEEFGYRRLAFADALKAAALSLDPIVTRGIGSGRLSFYVSILGWEAAKDVPEVRRTLQRLGTAIRDHDRNVWVRPVATAIAEDDDPVVVTDVRFPNEADMIRDLGGIVLRVERPGMENDDPHPSEAGIAELDADGVIHNRGDLAELAETARWIASNYSVLYSSAEISRIFGKAQA